jgi:hypothetical protein
MLWDVGMAGHETIPLWRDLSLDFEQAGAASGSQSVESG